MRITLIILLASCLLACKEKKPSQSIELISSISKQDSLFRSLMAIVDYGIPEKTLSDSLAFLILPVEASCPSCRKKTIDSLLKHSTTLQADRYVVISASAGWKNINRYFLEKEKTIPDIPGQLFLDSTNLAYRHGLFKDNPALYYAYDRKVYKRVFAIPATVKADLQEFFSGYR